MRTSRTPEDWKVLRRVAVELLQDGMTQEAVAERLQVSLSSIKRWKKAFQQGGLAALAPKPRQPTGRRLSTSQGERLRQILLAGPLVAGFSTDLWTCRRVAEVVRREFDISYHPDHLGRILHDLGFSPQKPQRRARERDEAAIARWRREDWPRIKKRDDAFKLLSSCSTKPALFCNR
jgi:transposase